MSKGKSKAANNQRANVKNSNHPSYTADRANRIQQGHKNVPAQPMKTAVTNPQK